MGRTGPARRRILFVTGQLGLGGAERQLFHLVTGLDPTRFETRVLTLNPGAGDYWEERLRSAGIPVGSIPRAMAIRRALEIRRQVKTWNPDVLHCFNFYTNGYGVLARWPGRLPLVGGIRFWPTREAVRRFPGPVWWRICLRGVDVVVCNSVVALETLERAFSRLPRRMAIANGVAVPSEEEAVRRRTSARDELGAEPNQVWIGFVGSLIPRKNLSLLLHACAALADEHPELRLAVLGDGPLRAELEAEASRLGIADRVKFRGAVPRAEEWMPGFDLFCLPSHAEGMPNVLMEAAAAGLAVVATGVCGSGEVVRHGESGFLVAPGELSDLRARIRTLVVDRELRRQFGQCGRELMRREFSTGAMVAAYENLYEGLSENGMDGIS